VSKLFLQDERYYVYAINLMYYLFMENIVVVKGKDDIELSVKIIQSPMAGHLGANETYNRILTPFYRPK
jgi:hypothetical protein